MQIAKIKQLHVFDTSNPDNPVLVGAIESVRGRDMAFNYTPAWIDSGFALSGDMTLSGDTIYSRGSMPGAISDAMPDRWGESMMRVMHGSIGNLDKLFYTGDMRFGCLGFSIDKTKYIPADSTAVPSFKELDQLVGILEDIGPVPRLTKEQSMLASSTRSMGGAHKKALVGKHGEWIVKLPEGGYVDTPLIEHATLKMASMCGINTVESEAIPLSCGHAVAIKRFDKDGNKKIHCLSAHTAILHGLNEDIRTADNTFGYANIADLVRITGSPETREEVFRRMVFNIMIDNTDDHEKNHAFMYKDNQWVLSPCYDILPLMSGYGFHQLRIGTSGAEGSKENALSECERFGMDKDRAEHVWNDVENTVKNWREIYSHEGVLDTDIDALSEFMLADSYVDNVPRI